MNSKVLHSELTTALTIDESVNERQSIAYLMLEAFFGLSRTDVLMEKAVAYTPAHRAQVETAIIRLNQHEPLQYILGECPFYGRTFTLCPDVLIPRPETEELVHTVLAVARQKNPPLRILDIGTGSGCIAVTLACELPNASVFATDVSTAAIACASANATRLQAQVQFLLHDILTDSIPESSLDIIVSNPPYIAVAEKAAMKKNVLNYEPHLALFAPSDNPLAFYEAIVSRSTDALKTEGLLAVEVNAQFAHQVANLFAHHAFEQITVIRDINGHERFVTGNYRG